MPENICKYFFFICRKTAQKKKRETQTLLPPPPAAGLCVTYISDKSVWEKMNSSDRSILAPGQHNVVGDGQQAVDGVRVPGILVAVISVGSLVEEIQGSFSAPHHELGSFPY